jgi:hypothetical protein
MTHWSLGNDLFSLQLFAYFLLLFLLLHSSFNTFWSDRMQVVISIFLYFLMLALCPKIWSILNKVPWLLRRMYIVLPLDEIVCRHQLSPFDLWCHLVLGFFIDFLFEWPIYWWQSDIKISHYNCVGVICAFKSFNVHLMKLGALTLGVYMLIIVISFWYISPFISMKCPLSFDQCSFEVYFVWYKYCYSCLFLGPLVW